MASRRALKAVLIDLSGTLHIEDTAVPGAQEALNRWETAAERDIPQVRSPPTSCNRRMLVFLCAQVTAGACCR